MSDPAQIDFDIRGMAAALNMTEDEARAAYQCGEIAAPDSFHFAESRWSALALGAEIKKRLPANLTAPERILASMEALLCAERAEGWHDEKQGHEPAGEDAANKRDLSFIHAGVKPEYDTWPHTRSQLAKLRDMAATEEELSKVAKLADEFDAEDNAAIAAGKAVRRIQNNGRHQGGDDV